jgi:(2Fe-2S) ferredoxin
MVWTGIGISPVRAGSGSPGSLENAAVCYHSAAMDRRERQPYNRIMPPLERHLFVCVNERAPDNPKGCCAHKDAVEIRSRLKRLAFEAGLRGKVRINSAGCLDQCSYGTTIVVYPEAVWYGNVSLDDVEELFNEHVLNGRPVERLRLDRLSEE